MRLPDFENIRQILVKIGKKSRIKLIEKAGKAVKIGKVYTQHAGCDMDYVKQVIRIATINAEIPEPLRISHLISAGIVVGESKGNT